MFGLHKEKNPVYDTLAQIFYIGTGLFFLLTAGLYIGDFIGEITITLPFVGTLLDTTISVRPQTVNLLLTLTFGCGIGGLLMELMQIRKKPDDDFKETQKGMDLR